MGDKTSQPTSEADYQNNTYFGRVQAVSREGAALLQTTDDSDSDEPVITLTNVAESPPRTFEDEGSASVGSTSGVKKVDGPHLLRRGLLVPVWGVVDDSDPEGSGVEIAWFTCINPSPLWVKLTGAQAIPGESNRWRYTWIEQEYLGTGRWRDLAGGLTSDANTASNGESGSGAPRYAYNTLEANNTAAGVMGNGYNVSTLASQITFNPIRGGGVHRLYAQVTCDGLVEYVFTASNALQGECP
jgi:hypothetical protein